VNLKTSSPQSDKAFKRTRPVIDRREIDTVFLDLDGTLLDKHFDDYFWEQFVPNTYAQHNGVSFSQSRELLLSTYRSVESTLQWTDLDFWSEKLGLDIPALKKESSQLVAIRPHTLFFLQHLGDMKVDIFLATNAHPKALEIKMEKVDLRSYFKEMVCSQDLGAAKEQLEFWVNLQEKIPFNPNRTLFVDDTEKVLHSAREFGIQHLIHIAKPSSKLEPHFSTDYQSIVDFNELVFEN
jgi:HAD superfamily hydrolase (TIGR01509 family)